MLSVNGNSEGVIIVSSPSGKKVNVAIRKVASDKSPGRMCVFEGRKIDHPFIMIKNTKYGKWNDMRYALGEKNKDLSKFIFTLKADGCCCLVSGGKLYMRYESRKELEIPKDWIKVGISTEKYPICMRPLDPKIDKHAARCMEDLSKRGITAPDGSYELVGEKVNGNNHQLKGVYLCPHSTIVFDFTPEQKTFDFLECFFKQVDVEGFVCYNPETKEIYKIRRNCFEDLDWPAKDTGCKKINIDVL